MENIETLQVGLQFKILNAKEITEEASGVATQMGSLTSKTSNVDTSSKKIKDAWKQTGKELNKIVGSAKKFLFSLLTVRGVWFMIRKSMTMYLSQNEELQNRLNACYYALGSLFAPALEKIINVFATIVAYASALAKSMGFAGINMSKFGKGAKAAQKSLLAIDEINNLQDKQDSGTGTGAEAIAEIPIDESKVDMLKRIAEAVAAIGLGFAAWKISSNLGKALGLTEKQCLGIGIAVEGFAYALFGLLDYIKNPSWENFGKIITGIGVGLAGIAIAIGSTTLGIVGLVIGLLGLIATHWDTIKVKMEEFANWLPESVSWIVSSVITLLDGLFVGVRTILDGIIMMFNVGFLEGLKLVGKGVVNILIGVANTLVGVVNGLVLMVETAVNFIIDCLNKLSWDIPDWVPVIGGKHFGFNIEHIVLPKIPEIPMLEVGTNYVPNDQLAYLHKGEAVVPKKFNSSEFFGEASAEELNLLSSINEQLVELNRKDTTINLDSENVARVVSNAQQRLTQRNGNRVFALNR